MSVTPTEVQHQVQMAMPRVPKYSPPPIPMPHSERTIYIHAETETPEFKPEDDKVIEISGKRVVISALAQKEIENAAKDLTAFDASSDTLNAQVKSYSLQNKMYLWQNFRRELMEN